MTHLVQLAWKTAEPDDESTSDIAAFPFSVPAIRSLPTLSFTTPVTFFVGENGTGKSTLLESIAISAALSTVGSQEVWFDRTLAPQRKLANALQLSWTRRTRRGFFLRAEDFFGYLKQQARTDARLLRERSELAAPPSGEEIDPRPAGPEHVDEEEAAQYLARYDCRSHGESFLDMFSSRLTEAGLYLLDEPETPLSPQRQIAFLALLLDAVQRGAQFIIATHSPILLAYPGARIYSFDTAPVEEVAFGDLDHVRVTRDFLNSPERFLRHLA